MDRVYFSVSNPPPLLGEVGGGEVLVERAGYISAQQRIENMMQAGQRLVAARAEQYDFSADIDEDVPCDPTRSGNYDLADATQQARAVDARLRAVKAARAAKAAADKAAADVVKVASPD